MRGSSRRAEWVRVCTAEYLRLRTQIEPDPVLRPYATENPSEFFAVACEAFFEPPLAIQEHKPALYARSTERRAGKDCVSTWSYQWSPSQHKHKTKKTSH